MFADVASINMKSGVSGYNKRQATKGIRWMPRRLEAMKDVGSCDKLWGAATQAVIRRFLNGKTHTESCRYILS
jgi:hypothetical protein